MPAWLAPLAISAGTSLLGGLFGGKKQKQTYGLGREQQGLYRRLMGELGKLPSYVTSGIKGRWGRLRRGLKESTSPGLEGLLGARLKRATAGEGREIGEATERHRMGILGNLTSLLGGTGTRTGEMGADWGGIFGGMGEDVGFLWGLEQMLKGGKQPARRPD